MNAEQVRYFKKKIMRIILTPLKVMPVKKNRVLLINDLAYNYSDNPMYVAEELINRENNYEIIFSVADVKKNGYLNEKGIKLVRFNSFMYFFYGLTSKVLLTNSGGISYIPLRKTQCVINTWHGGGTYKKVGIHMYEDTKLFRKDLQLASRNTTLFTSTCHLASVFLGESLLIPLEKFWEIGMPRNDVLIQGNDKLKENVCKKIGLNNEEKLVLFAPTYRKQEDNYFNDSISIFYGIDKERVVQALEKRFGGKWVFAYRLHPCVQNESNEFDEDTLNLSNYPNMQELLLAADVLINDFSSSMWDFMLTKKPCFIYAKDLQHYIETTEVYTPVSEWPFSSATSNDELVSNILTYDENDYQNRCKIYYDNLGGCETGESSKMICDYIDDICF